VRIKAALLLALQFSLVLGFAGYVLYARGTFESTQRLVLMAANSEGISVGADLSFSGFPIGRVERIELAQNGQARIEIDVPKKDARWLRAGSVFTLERGLVGGARLRAFTGNLDDAPLPDGAVREVLRGDTTDELPGLIANLSKVLENVQTMTAPDSSLAKSLAGVSTQVARLSERGGALSVLLGGDEEAKKVIEAIDRTNRLLTSVDSLAKRLDGAVRTAEGTLEKADARLFGDAGVVEEARRAVAQLGPLLGEAREALKKADAALADLQRIGANTRAATEDLAGLRGEVEASLRKASDLIDEVNRKWPFRRDTELRLP
jgi:phospholipid/cholesterol/gamma-HCH transport system substrate-binding protein